MALVSTKQGRMEDLKLMLGQDLVLHLYVNDFIPDYDSAVEDFDEVGKESYIQKVLLPNEWDFDFSPKDNPVAVYPEITFKFLAAGFTVYGYFVTSKEGTVVRWAERFPKNEHYDIFRQGDALILRIRCELSGFQERKKKAIH